MTEEKEYLGPSLDPDDAISGGLFDNKVAEWTECRFEMFDYNGTQPPSPVFSVTLVPVDGDDAYTQKYSVGKPDFWAPTDDGTWIRPVGTEEQLRKSSNMNILMKSLIEGGMPKSLLKERNVTVLNGLVAHMERKEVSGREDLQKDRTKRRGADGKEYERDNKILLVSQVVSLPGEKEEKGGKKGGKTAPKKDAKGDPKGKGAQDKPAQNAGGNVADKARAFVAQQVVAGGGKVDKKELPNAAFKELAADPDRNAILAIIFKNEEILALGGFAIDDAGVITLG